MAADKRLLQSLRLTNLLSFGPESSEIELGPLNVLIGPNGSGKSNLIEAISLLQAAPTNLLDPIQTGGGIAEWLWKGMDVPPVGEIDVRIARAAIGGSLRHRLSLGMRGQRADLVDESIGDGVASYYRRQNGRPQLYSTFLDGLSLDRSVLSEIKEPTRFPEITYLGKQYVGMRLYREWNLGRFTPPRRPQPSDLSNDFLSEDAANLSLVLNDLEHRGQRRMLVEKLRDADESIEDFSTKVLGGTIQLFLHYKGLKSPVPATRLSDGTIRYLCLLAVLCHPEPPPLVCLEEPEVGLHPDLLARLAELLVEASQRMQLIVTTHSDVLVDGLSSTPESVIVCEKHDGSTTMHRKSREELAKWLKDDYGLGQLWRSGEIGGNRW